jgi:hypothetical protein
MKHIESKKVLAAVAMFFMLSACMSILRSNVISDSTLVSEAASVIGVPASDLTLSGRDNEDDEDGIGVTYNIDTKAGHTYRCLMWGGALGHMGKHDKPRCDLVR